MQQLAWNEDAWRGIIEALHEHRDVTGLNHDILGSAIAPLAKTFASQVSMTDYTMRLYGLGRVLELCLKTGGVDAAGIFLERALQPETRTAPKAEDDLFSLVPDIRRIALAQARAPTADPFASASRSIMLLYIQKELPPRPHDPEAESCIANIANWRCQTAGCEDCPAVKDFLTSQPGTELTLARIGAVRRKHVEQQLSRGSYGARFEAITNRSPQGIKVSSMVSGLPSLVTEHHYAGHQRESHG
jgi:hypothetical protein